jgi:hypothetical protein
VEGNAPVGGRVYILEGAYSGGACMKNEDADGRWGYDKPTWRRYVVSWGGAYECA